MQVFFVFFNKEYFVFGDSWIEWVTLELDSLKEQKWY